MLEHVIVSAAVHAHLHGDVTYARNVLEVVPVRSPKRKQVREWLQKFAPVTFDESGSLLFKRSHDTRNDEARAAAIAQCQQAAHLIFGRNDCEASNTQQAASAGSHPTPKDSRRFDLADELAKLITRAERAKIGLLTTGAVSVDDSLLNKLKAACPISWDAP